MIFSRCAAGFPEEAESKRTAFFSPFTGEVSGRAMGAVQTVPVMR